MITTILFNGPPNSGKDALGGAIADALDVPVLRFKDELYKATADQFKVDYDWMVKMASDRNTKEVKTDDLIIDGHPISPRDALIHTSENVIKPNYGPAYFGLHTALRLQHGFNIITDSGFDEELLPIIANSHRVIGVKLFAAGCDFGGDSRKYLDWDRYRDFYPHVKYLLCQNDKSSGVAPAALQLLGRILTEAM